MAKVTLIKPYRQTETLRVLELTDVIEMIRGNKYYHVVDELRRLYPVFDLTRQVSGQGEMLTSVLLRPTDDNVDAKWMSLKEISAMLKRSFKGYKEKTGSFHKIGLFLSRPEYRFKSQHKMTGNVYWVKLTE